MYVCMHVCMHVCMYVHIYIYTGIHISVYMPMSMPRLAHSSLLLLELNPHGDARLVKRRGQGTN